MLIKETYEIVTEESAEYGDWEECGWKDKEGIEFNNRGLTESVNYLAKEYSLYASSSHWAPGTWYTTHEEVLYSGKYQGGRETRSFHLSGLTRREEKFIARSLVALGIVRGLKV